MCVPRVATARTYVRTSDREREKEGGKEVRKRGKEGRRVGEGNGQL